MPILLLIVGILFVYAGISSENIGVYIGGVQAGLVCMFLAVVCLINGDD